jgi:hypothetical protein
MRKNTIIAVIIAIIATAGICEAGSLYGFYKKLVKREKIATVREYWTEDLTGKILRTRGDDLIIEKCIGTVTNNKKDGHIFGAGEYDYISYKHVKGAKKGDVIYTIMIHTPGGADVDEIESRFDFIIDRTAK